MSMPNIPDINPNININRREVIDLLLASIGLEELSLAHIINAEAEKLQYVVASKPTLHDLLKVNKSVLLMLRSTIKKEMLLQFKLENVLDLIEEEEIIEE